MSSDRKRLILERLYPYLKAVNHIHMCPSLKDGYAGEDILYASEVWDALQERSGVTDGTRCQCRVCKRWGFVLDEFTSPYSGRCGDCEKAAKDE